MQPLQALLNRRCPTCPVSCCLQVEGEPACEVGSKALADLRQASLGVTLGLAWMRDENGFGVDGEEDGYDSAADEGPDEGSGDEEPVPRVCVDSIRFGARMAQMRLLCLGLGSLHGSSPTAEPLPLLQVPSGPAATAAELADALTTVLEGEAAALSASCASHLSSIRLLCMAGAEVALRPSLLQGPRLPTLPRSMCERIR